MKKRRTKHKHKRPRYHAFAWLIDVALSAPRCPFMETFGLFGAAMARTQMMMEAMRAATW